MQLSASDRDQGFDTLRLERCHGGAAGVAGIGQHTLRQTDGGLHCQDGSGKARRIGGRGDEVGRQDQLRPISAC